MGGVAEGVKEGDNVLGKAFVNGDHVRFRNADVLCKRAVAVNADADGVLAPLDVACVAVAAAVAGDVALAGDALANVQTRYACAKLRDLADILMADGHGRLDVLLRPRIPVVNVDIRAADGGFVDLDENLSRTRHGNRHLP